MHIIAGFTICTLLYGLSYEAKVPTKVPSKSQYYVWPANDTNSEKNTAILSQLQSWVVDDQSISISQIGNDLSSVTFYLVGLTGDQATQLNETSTVRPFVSSMLASCLLTKIPRLELLYRDVQAIVSTSSWIFRLILAACLIVNQAELSMDHQRSANGRMIRVSRR